MTPGISTQVFLPQQLSPSHLDALVRAGAQAIEIFAARHHFDYADRQAIREIGAWFKSNDIRASLHQPIYPNAEWSRHLSPTLNLIDLEKMRRIDAMDEVKRALESAEQVPFRAAVIHLGMREDKWNERSLDHAITALEHLDAFAQPLGLQLVVENLQNDVTEPEHILEILKIGHFGGVGLCLDIGHAHLQSDTGIADGIATFGARTTQIHLHDNHGMRDEHLWPGSGTIDWAAFERLARTLPADTPAIIEVAHPFDETPETVIHKAHAVWDRFKRAADVRETLPAG